MLTVSFYSRRNKKCEYVREHKYAFFASFDHYLYFIIHVVKTFNLTCFGTYNGIGFLHTHVIVSSAILLLSRF